MTIALRAAGTPTTATAAITAINPSVPAGWQSGDASFLEVGARDSTIGFPALIKSGTDPGDGWTKLAEFTGGAGAFGVDTGTGKTAFYYRLDSPVAPGNIPFTNVPANASACAAINIYSKDPAKTWDLSVSTSVSDNTQSTNYDANAGGANPQIAVGDLLAFIRVFSADGGTITGEAIAVPGCTMGAVAVRSERTVQTGHDMRLGAGDVAPTAGTSTGAPQHTYNSLQGGTGHTAFLRLRETAPQTQTVTPSGIASTAAVGSPTVTPGPVAVTPAGIASTAAVGSPTVAPGPVTITPGSIASTAAVGTPELLPGPVTITPGDIASTAEVSIPTLLPGDVTLHPGGISSSAAVGTPTLLPGPVTITPASIESTAAVGTPTLYEPLEHELVNHAELISPANHADLVAPLTSTELVYPATEANLC